MGKNKERTPKASETATYKINKSSRCERNKKRKQDTHKRHEAARATRKAKRIERLFAECDKRVLSSPVRCKTQRGQIRYLKAVLKGTYIKKVKKAKPSESKENVNG